MRKRKISDDVKGFFALTGIILFIISLIYLSYENKRNQYDKMDNWCVEHHITDQVIEQSYFDSGPFWWESNKNCAIYRIVGRLNGDQRIVIWVKFGGWFGPRYYKENKDESYTQL